MILAAILVAVAAYAAAGPDTLAKLRAAAGKVRLPAVEGRHVAAAALLAAAGVVYAGRQHQPAPAPPDPTGLSLRGLWVGPTASSDAATVGALMEELAAAVEYDGLREEPIILTGVAVDDLRRAARELRCRGESIGDRQPRARDAIAAHLDQTAGTAGGPLTGKTRSAWVAAYRDVGRAAADAAR